MNIKFSPIKFLFLFFFCCFLITSAQQKLIKKGTDYYLSNTVVIKLKQSPGTGKNIVLPDAVQKTMSKYSVVSVKNRFTENKKSNSLLKTSNSLDRIITIKYASNEDPLKVAAKLMHTHQVEWAEPHFVREVFYTPNDPKYNLATQYGLFKILADSAWNITKGDTSIVIGIIDTGVYWGHPDLEANIWQNLGEDANHNGKTIIQQNGTWILDPGDLNGIDDDNNGAGNGYVDDLIGWDFGGINGIQDNNPQEDNPTHGTLVAGIASGVTDNGLGVASIGFKCKIMPVKTTRHDVGDRSVIYGFDGIKYAADNGAKIINCSFGGTVYSNAEQAVINYVVAKGALVVAAAGNSGNGIPQYPASYKGVLSVGATTKTDEIWSASSYGLHVDVTAPGAEIYSTWGPSGYTGQPYPSGTSLSSPFTAGLAALVATVFPSYGPLQIAEQIRVNTDSIAQLNSASLRYLAGSGRINAYKALTNKNSISIRVDSVEFTGETNNHNHFKPGETVSIGASFVNYLKPVSNVTVTVESGSQYAEMIQDNFSIGSLNTLGSTDNFSNGFVFKISNDVPFDTELPFMIKYSSSTSNYDDFEWISVRVNSTYETMDKNNITFTINSKGSLGFNDYPSNVEGSGFIFRNGDNLMYEGGFLYGTGPDNLMDAVRQPDDTKSQDFNIVDQFILTSPGSIADEQGFTVFNDDGAGSKKLGIETKLNSYEFIDAADANYVIVSTDLYNHNSENITGLYAGLFLDWDINGDDFEDDIASYDSLNSFGYAYDSNGIPVSDYVGAALISDNNYGFYAIDNGDTTGGSNAPSSFTDKTKWITISSGVASTHKGPADISFVVSGGPYDIPANHHINVAFAIAGGRDLDELTTAIKNARIKYASLPTDVARDDNSSLPVKFDLMQNYPNPFNPATTIGFSIPSQGNVQLKIYDILGREVTTLVNKVMSPGNYKILFNADSLPSGVYIYKLSANGYIQAKKMLLLK